MGIENQNICWIGSSLVCTNSDVNSFTEESAPNMKKLCFKFKGTRLYSQTVMIFYP